MNPKTLLLSTIVVFVLICGCTLSVQALEPAINVHVTPQAVAMVGQLLNLIGHSLISNVVLPLPPVPISTVDFSANLTDMTLYNIQYTNIALTIVNNQGIQVDVTGVTGHLNYTLDYHINFPKQTGSYNGDAYINGTSAVLLVTVTEVSGVPLVQIPSSELDVGYIDLGLTGTLESLTQFLEPVIEKLLDTVFEQQIVPQLNAQFLNMSQTISMVHFIDPMNLTVIDLSLTSNPTFSSTAGIGVSLYANIHPTAGPECSYSTPNLQTSYNREFEAFVGQSVLDCFLWASVQSNLSNIMINQLIAENLDLHDRMGFGVMMTDGIGTIQPSGLTVGVSLLLGIDRLTLTPERWITIGLNESLSVMLSLNQSGSGLVLYPVLEATQTKFNVVYTAPDMWDSWLDQINQTNFMKDSFMITTAINTMVLPKINAKLASGIALPAATSILAQPELLFFSGYVYVGFNLGLGEHSVGVDMPPLV